MFKSVLAGALVFAAQGVYAQDSAKDFAYSGERIDLTSPVMNIEYLFTETHEVKDSSVQGAAVYGKYLFQFNNYRERCAIYDLETGKLVQTIELERDKLLHCNNANFSRQYYDGSDPFPLLYISMENILKYNPNGSMYAIEGMTSPDGRVLGKMGHTERTVGTNPDGSSSDLIKNVGGNKCQNIFRAGVRYFS